MIVTATHRQKLTIDLDNNEVEEIVKKYVADKANWRSDYFIENGEVKYMEEVHTSHSWFEEKTVRKATDVDRAIVLLIASNILPF